MKRGIFILLLLTGLCIWNADAQQTVTQEQCQQVDAQLNQVYQQLRGTLNDAQKQQLKLTQRDWIKKRDAFVAANRSNPQGALYQATMQRVGELTGSLGKLTCTEKLPSGTSTIATNSNKQVIFQASQGVTQAKCDETDAKLNQLYKQLLGSLNEDQEQQLKLAQRDWIKKRDALVAEESINQNERYYNTTMERVWDFQAVLIRFENGSNEIVLIKSLELKPISSSRFAAIKKIIECLKISNLGESIEKEIIELKDRLNGCKELIKPKLEEQNQFLEPIVSRGWNYRERADMSKHLNALWPREKDSEWKLKWKEPEPTVQTEHKEKTISKASSHNMVAKSYKNDTSIYIYDKKSNIQIASINPDRYFFYNRDKGLCPQDLAFSQDGRLLCFKRNTGGYVGGVTYIVNTESWEVIYKICGEPIFVKSKNGEVRLLDAEGTVGNSRLEPSDISWVYDGSVERIRERFNSEKNNSLRKEDITSHYENCSSENKGQIADPFIVFNKTNVVSNFIVSWPSVLGDLSLNINLTDFNVKINNIKITPTTSLGKIPENNEIPCFWGYLYNTNHLCFRRTATGSSWCAKDLNHDKTYVSSDNRYFLPIYCYDNASSPSGWQIRQSIGVFDSLNKKWIALPEIEPPWGGNIRTTRFSGEDMPSSPVDIPICLPKAISPPNDLYRHHYYSPTTKILWISSSNDGLIKINLDTSVMEARYTGITPFQVFCAEDNLILGIPRVDTPRLELWKQSPLQKIADFFVASDGNIIAVCDNSYYATPHGNSHMVGFRIGNKGSPLEQYDLRLNRPDIVLERLGSPKEAIETAKFLREKRLKRMGVTEEMLKPDFHLPELQIAGDVPATTSKDQLDLKIKATDDKYPLDRLRVYVNNVPVNGRDGELLRDQKTQTLEKTIPIKLATGRNKIQVSVLNNAGAESLYANAEVNCTADRPKPKLYAVALGVSQYDRPEWCLKYAAKDATDLIGKLKAKSGSSYCEVKPLLLTDKEVTKESVAKIKEFLAGATIDDTVLIFMAGHGLLDDKYDYYFGTSDIDPVKPSERGMPYEAIDNILAEVPSLKKALLMDTCHAGELDDDEKKELATSDGKGTVPAASSTAAESAIKGTVAMRAIGTRGMSVKAVQGAKGKSDWYEKLQDMFVDLRRGSGATVISSSQGAEYAFESSEQSNGLFTYALMEALDGKATSNKDGQITISNIGDYVKKRVQDLTKGKQNPNLRGVNLEEDFALSSTK